MSETAGSAGVTAWQRRRPAARAAAWDAPDARRWLQLGLAGLWLLDGVLQFQSFMFTRAFSQMIGATAAGNPAVVATPISWDARLVAHHAAGVNTAFATIQVLLALGIAWRPTVRITLGASVAWALGVWWFGEGLGAVLTGNASPVSGAPGAVIIYALLAVLLWPADRTRSAPFVAARPLGVLPARLLWLTLWGSLAYFAVQSANRTPQGLHDMITTMSSGEPGWLVSVDRHAASLLAGQGGTASVILAVVLGVVAVSVFLPASAARAGLVLAVVTAAAIWVVGEALGGLFTGAGTDPNSGPLLALLAIAYWPSRTALPDGAPPARRLPATGPPVPGVTPLSPAPDPRKG